MLNGVVPGCPVSRPVLFNSTGAAGGAFTGMKHLTIAHKLTALIIAMAVMVGWMCHLMVGRLHDSAYDTRHEMLQTQVESAIAIMAHYHQMELDGTLTRDDAMARAFAAVGAMRYEPHGYIFVSDADGIFLVHPSTALVGTDQSGLADETGRLFVREFIDIALAGGGLTYYKWALPGQDPDLLFDKVSYTALFEPWGAVAGTGAFVEDIETMIAAELRRMTMIGGATIGLMALLAIIFGRTITRPLKRVRAALDAVAQDDTDAFIPYTTGTNEAGRMAKSTFELQNKVRKRLALEREQAQDRAALDAERQQNQARQQAEGERQTHVVATIRTALEAVADGDLTVRCDDLGDQDAALREHFNTAIGKLEQAMGQVTIKGSDIAASKDDIRRASMDLSQRTERQAANLEETSAALEELSEAVRQTAEGARDAASRVVSVSQETETSDAIVNEAILAMSGIEQSSAQIGNIIGVIEDIAFQTNLLALNAGVEAARAGESGKGFAVVAQEVRELAQRSSAAAKDVKDQIAGSSAQVENGVRLVGDTGEALKRIFEQIKGARDIVSSIAQSASEQDTTLRSLTSAMNDMDATTQQNAAMAEETTACTQALASDTEELLNLINRFRVSGQATATFGMGEDMRMAG